MKENEQVPAGYARHTVGACESEFLSAAAVEAINSGGLVMSVASYWEVIVKIKNGQLTISADPASWWLRATRDLRGTVLAIRAGHVAAVHKLQDHHKDPFDRILIAQAMVEGIGLVTSDEAIQMYPVKTIW